MYTITGFKGNDGLGVVSGNASCPPTGTQFVAPGAYSIKCALGTLSAANYTFAFVDGTMTVNQEDARSYYTGNTLFWGTTASATSANVTLSATIKDITAVTGDLASDAFPGDIRKAKVTFVNRDASNAELTGCRNLSVGLVSSSDTTVGTVTCTTSLNIGSSGGSSYNIGIVVGGYYIDNSSTEDTTIEVADPITSYFITGGGYLSESSSAGTYAADAGSKSNFGFNVKFNKGGTNLQGNLNIIIRKDRHVYQIKSNSLTSLGESPSPCAQATSTSPCKANFVSKATLQDITNPNSHVSLGGNLTFQMSMTDKGEPGSSDTIAFALYDSANNLLFSSKWNGTKTVEQMLGGGNLVVH